MSKDILALGAVALDQLAGGKREQLLFSHSSVTIEHKEPKECYN